LSSLSLFSTVSIGTREAVVRLWLVGSQSLDTEAELSIASCSMFNEGTTINPARCTANSCVPTIHAINDRTILLAALWQGRTSRPPLSSITHSTLIHDEMLFFWLPTTQNSMVTMSVQTRTMQLQGLMQEKDIFSHGTFGEVRPPLYRWL
jgi:hypothetical protein